MGEKYVLYMEWRMIMEQFNKYHEIKIDKTKKYREVKKIKINLEY